MRLFEKQQGQQQQQEEGNAACTSTEEERLCAELVRLMQEDVQVCHY